jgi:D-glycero-D-manno-heptose 1,7-bisphosphate phosphatase
VEAGRPAIFLDRDGVLNRNIDGDYVRDWSQFEWLPGAFEALRILQGTGRPLVVLTNQAMIAKGLSTLEALADIHRRMAADLEARGVRLAGVFFCPHRPEDKCDCRKPAPGLFHRAAHALGLDVSRSIMIGDRPADEEAAGRAGCARTYLVTPERTFVEIAREIARVSR